MIGKIKGILSEIEGNLGLVKTSSGVFYQLYLTPSIISTHKVNDDIEVYTFLQVREDALVLFGFRTKDEHTLFKMLLSVSGVGPKTAFSVISFSSTSEVVDSVKKNDVDYFSRIPGLGKKTAMKIILELSQKFESDFKLEKMYLTEEDKTVIEALVSLGFKQNEAKRMLTEVPKNLSLEEKIKKAIQIMTKKI